MAEPGTLKSPASRIDSPADTGPLGPALVAEAFAKGFSDPTRARTLAREAAVLAEAAGDRPLLAQAWHALGLADCVVGRVAEGAAHLQEAAASLRQTGPALAECRALRDLGGVLTHLTGDLPGALDVLERAGRLAAELQDRHEHGMVQSRLGPLFGRLGRLDDAEQALVASVEALADGPSVQDWGTALDNLGYLYIQRGEYTRALGHLHRAAALASQHGDRTRRINAQANVAIAQAGCGQLAQALQLLDELATQLDPTQDGYQWADYLLTCGRVRLMGGDATGARRSLSEGLDFARAQGLLAAEVDLLEQLSIAEERCQDLAASLQHQRELRAAERRWLDDQAASRVRVLQSGMELSEQRAVNRALEEHRAQLEQRVAERTEALHRQVHERQVAEERARYWAEHDWLTRLPNRHRLQVELAAALAQARRCGHRLGLLFIDLDGFKAINDSHGHEAGDRMLRATARRLLRAAPPGATVTRFGGDEFVVLLPGLATMTQALAAAESIRKAVRVPLKFDGHRMGVSCSVGIACGPDDADSADALIRVADRAMLEAKASGRNQIRTLDALEQQRLERRSRLRRDLGEVLAQGGLEAAFQPISLPVSGQVAGIELLARWFHPELGEVSPLEFVPLAEESGQIAELGAWAVQQALRAVRRLRLVPGVAPNLRVSVNLSPRQLSMPGLLSQLNRLILAEQADPSWIEFELTESVQLAQDEATHQRLLDLRNQGFRLALDDFGAGYSSFSYLSRQVFTRLKIDRSLVQTALPDPDSSAVTAAIIAMAHGLGLEVVAEGVETATVRESLGRQGCDLVQGFQIARPMPLQALLDWLPQAGLPANPHL